MVSRVNLQERINKILERKRRVYPFCITLNSKIFILESGGRKYILKERYSKQLDNEYRILRFLQEKKFPHIPKVYGIVRLDGKRMLFQDFMEGSKVERDKSIFYQHAGKIAQILAKLYLLKQQSKKPAYYFVNKEVQLIEKLITDTRILFARQDHSWLSSFFSAGEKYFNSITAIIQNRKQQLKFPLYPSIVNREMEFVITGNKQIYLLDWESAGFGDYAYDIADLNYIYQDMDVSKFIGVFKTNAGISEDMLLRVNLYLPLIIIKEIYYYILDYAICELYRNIPLKVTAYIAEIRLGEKLRRLADVYRKLNSLKNP